MQVWVQVANESAEDALFQVAAYPAEKQMSDPEKAQAQDPLVTKRTRLASGTATTYLLLTTEKPGQAVFLAGDTVQPKRWQDYSTYAEYSGCFASQ